MDGGDRLWNTVMSDYRLSTRTEPDSRRRDARIARYDKGRGSFATYLCQLAALCVLGLGIVDCRGQCEAKGASGLNNGGSARIVYVSMEGSGKQNGQSQGDSLPFGRLQELLNSLRHDLIVRFSSGEFRLERPLVIFTSDFRTRFVGDGNGTVLKGSYHPGQEGRGYPAFVLMGDQITIENISFESLGSCVKTLPYFSSRHVRLLRLRASEMYSCMVVDRSQQAPVADWRIEDLEVLGYYRSAIRFSGENTRDILISSVVLDGFNEANRNFCFKGGIQLFKGVSNIRIENSVIRNNIGDCEGRYQQGEGVEIDDKGGTPRHITISDLYIENSGDAGLDLKGEDISLIDVRVMGGPVQRYGFRFWNYDDYKCLRCISEGGRAAHIDLINAEVQFKESQFDGRDEHRRICHVNDRAKGNPSAVRFLNSSHQGRVITRKAPGCPAAQ